MSPALLAALASAEKFTAHPIVGPPATADICPRRSSTLDGGELRVRLDPSKANLEVSDYLMEFLSW
jgi:hypothetical protein